MKEQISEIVYSLSRFKTAEIKGKYAFWYEKDKK